MILVKLFQKGAIAFFFNFRPVCNHLTRAFFLFQLYLFLMSTQFWNEHKMPFSKNYFLTSFNHLLFQYIVLVIHWKSECLTIKIDIMSRQWHVSDCSTFCFKFKNLTMLKRMRQQRLILLNIYILINLSGKFFVFKSTEFIVIK